MHLTIDQIEAALPRVAAGLESYQWLQAELSGRDVSRDREFQRRFDGFYRVRRNAVWRDAFFRLLEQVKDSPVSFEDALDSLHRATGRVEASFTSKLVATADPTQPVIDSIVLKNLGLRLPAAAAAGRLGRIVTLHRELGERYERYLTSQRGRELVARFRRAYPHSAITEVKMLDLVLWQSRS